MKCKHCGARIKFNELRCPYCSHMNEQAENRRYMGKLHELHKDMEKLSCQSQKTLKHEIRQMLLITLAGIGIAVAFGFVWDYVTSGSSAMEIKKMDKYAEKKLIWMDEYFPVLDSLYEEENDNGLMKLYVARYELPEEYFYEWEHAELLEAMEQYAKVKELEKRSAEGKSVDSFDVTYAIEGGLRLLYEYDEKASERKLAKRDEEKIKRMSEETKMIFNNCLGISPEETEPLYLSFCEDDYFSYSRCREYAEKLYEDLSAGQEVGE